MRPKLVIFVISQLNVGGTEIHALKLARLVLNKSSFIPVIIVLSSKQYLDPRLYVDDLDIIFLDSYKLKYLKILKLLLSYRLRYYQIFIHSFIYDHCFWDVLIASIIQPFAYIIEKRNIQHWRSSLSPAQFAQLKVIDFIRSQLCTHVVSNSYSCMSASLRYNSIKLSKYRIIRNWLSSAPSTSKNHAIPMHFQKRQQINILSVGNVKEVKGQEDLIRALNKILQLQSNSAHIILHLVGNTNTSYASFLKNLVKDLSLGNNVIFHGSLIDYTHLLSEADVYINSSRAEGSSNTLVEAIAFDLPVVATNIGGNLEVVFEGQNGFLYSPGDYQSLANILNSFIFNHSKLSSFSCASRYIYRLYNSKLSQSKYLEIYK